MKEIKKMTQAAAYVLKTAPYQLTGKRFAAHFEALGLEWTGKTATRARKTAENHRNGSPAYKRARGVYRLADALGDAWSGEEEAVRPNQWCPGKEGRWLAEIQFRLAKALILLGEYAPADDSREGSWIEERTRWGWAPYPSGCGAVPRGKEFVLVKGTKAEYEWARHFTVCRDHKKYGGNGCPPHEEETLVRFSPFAFEGEFNLDPADDSQRKLFFGFDKENPLPCEDRDKVIGR